MRSGEGTPDLLTRSEVADFFRVAPATISRWVNDGHLTPFRINGVIRFQRDDVQRLLNAPPEAEGAGAA